MDRRLNDQVRHRANGCCEYCRLPEAVIKVRFVLDHITARQHGGDASPDNLALACARCNLHKGPNVAGIDPQTGRLTRLFHPRRDEWSNHFNWSGLLAHGRTDVGRTTIAVLNMNHPGHIRLRQELLTDGAFPPP